MTTANTVKYGSDDVRPILAAAQRPLTTAEVGERCREAHGRRRYVADGPDEVIGALRHLERAGEVVSAVHRRGPGEQDPNGHLADPAFVHARWWATTGLAERWRTAHAEAKARGEQAQRAADGIRDVWVGPGGPGQAPRTRWDAPGWPYTGPAFVTVDLDGEQAAWLHDLLARLAADGRCGAADAGSCPPPGTRRGAPS